MTSAAAPRENAPDTVARAAHNASEAAGASEGALAPRLERVLGRFDVTMLVMGSIIGAGIFNRPSQVAAASGSMSVALALWALGGVFAFTGAIVFSELGASLPQAGGQYVFIREAFGRFAAFVFGWVLLSGITSSALAFVAGVFAEHLARLLEPWQAGLIADEGFLRSSALGVIVAMTALNARGVRLGASFQNLAMLAKIAGLFFLCALGLYAWLGALPGAPLGSALPSVEPAAAQAFSARALFPAVLSVLLAYGGWQNVAAVAGEIRRPERTLPFGILAGTLGVVALYVAFNASLGAILGYEGLAASRTPAADAAESVVSYGGVLVASLVAISTLAFVQGVLMLAPRIYYAMAQDGVFFERAAYVHPRWRTPLVAILLQGAFGVLHVLLAGGDLDRLVNLCILCDLVFFTSSGVALFVLRRKLPHAARPYRAMGYPFTPLVFCLLSLVTVLGGASAAGSWRSAGLGSALFAVGGLLYLRWRARSGDGRAH